MILLVLLDPGSGSSSTVSTMSSTFKVTITSPSGRVSREQGEAIVILLPSLSQE